MKKRKGRYKIKAQDELRIIEFVALNRFATTKNIISELGLATKSEITVNNVLKDNGIYHLNCPSKPFINFSNQVKR